MNNFDLARDSTKNFAHSFRYDTSEYMETYNVVF